MGTRIWIGKGYRNVNPSDIVKTTKNVHSFACENCLRDSLFKTQGGYYKLNLDGILTFAFGSLNAVTFEQLHKILID
jgi:hypothetical protein